MGAKARLCSALAIALMLAGCINSPSAGEPTAEATPPATAAPTHLTAPAFERGAYTAQNCVEAGIVLLLPPAAAQSLLPPGFIPRDASDLFGLPLPSSMAALYLNAQRCATYNTTGGPLEVAQVNVYVQPPKAGTALAAGYDFYEQAIITTNPEVAAHLNGIGWTASLEALTLAHTTGIRGATAQAEAATLFSFDITAPAEDGLQGIGRFWRQTNMGLAFIEHHLNTVLAAGTVTCTLPAGALWTQAYGGSTCRPGEALGLALLPFDYTATFHGPGSGFSAQATIPPKVT